MFVYDSYDIDDVVGLFEVFEEEGVSVVDSVLSNVLFKGEDDGFFVGDSRQVDEEVFVSGFALDEQFPEIFFDL